MIDQEPGGVAAKHRGLWSPRREFESLPGYSTSVTNAIAQIISCKPRKLANPHTILSRRFPSRHKGCTLLLPEQDYTADSLLADRTAECPRTTANPAKHEAQCLRH